MRRLSDAIQAVKTHWKRYWGIYVCRGELFRCPWRYFRKKGGSCKENKVMAVLAYIGLLVLVPIFAAKDSKYARFHATQGLNITVLSVAQAIIYYILATIISIIFRGSIIFGVGGVLLTILGFINTILSIAFIVLAIYGIVNAVQGKCKKLPIIGKFDILGKFVK